MKRLLVCVLLAFGSCVVLPASAATPQTRAYAPENLRTLSYNDQVRVISLEYSEQANGRRIPDDQLRFYIDQINRSNWTFSRIKQDIAQSLGGNGGDGPQPPVAGTIRCESQDKRQRNCATPWASRSQLVRQLSGSACVEGQTWGSQRGTVWVSGGCRGEFAEARHGGHNPGNGNNYRVTCASTDGRYKACAWNASYGQPQLARQISAQPCVSGRSWGYDGRGLWVNNGCRAEFMARRGPNPGTDYSVTCSSTSSRPTTCAWNAGYGRPTLIQKLSDSPCVEGRSWGYQGGSSLWVSGGCRGRFGVR